MKHRLIPFVFAIFFLIGCTNRDGEIIDLINLVKKQNDDLKTQITALKKTTDSALVAVLKVNSNQVTTDKKIELIQADLKSLLTQIATLNTQMSTANADIGAIKTKIDALQAKCAELVAQISQLNSITLSLKNGLVAYYPFNGNTKDFSINKFDLIGTNISYSNDRTNSTEQTACVFNGKSSYLIGPSLPSIKSILSFAIWVKNTRTTAGGWGCLITTQNSTKQGFLLQDNENLKYDFSFANLNGTSYSDIWSTSILKVNEWELIICTYDGNVARIYKNGILETESTLGMKALSSDANLMIGSRYFNEFFKGTLDDIGIWNRVLSLEEINYLTTNSLKF
jgi:hypothetical protein